MPHWPILLAFVMALIASLALVLLVLRLGRRSAGVVPEDGIDPMPNLDIDDFADPALLRSRPAGRVYGELQRRVATPLKVESAAAYAERQGGLSPDVRAFVTRAPSQG